MKTFDWQKTKYNPQRKEWLKKNHNRKMSEKEFVEEWRQFKVFSTVKHKSKKNSPSRARIQYRKLKEDFGFFN